MVAPTSNWVLDRLPPTFAAPADVPPEWARYLRGVYGESVLAEAVQSMLRRHWRSRTHCRMIDTTRTPLGFYCESRANEMHQAYRMTRLALATLFRRGYDSVQFVRTEEHGIFKFEIIDLRPHRRVLSCYTNATYDRRITRRGCAYEWTPAMDMTAFRATPNASACPVTRGASGSAPSNAFSFGWAGQRGACRCIATAPRTRCIHCEGMSPLTREIMSE